MIERAKTEVSVVMPCFNEEASLESCIENASNFLINYGLKGEIIVVDNGSTDRSVEIAKSKRVKLVHESRRGYGSAYLKGFSIAQGDLVIMLDADGTYDLRDGINLIRPLQNGYDIVTGSRVNGSIVPGAMPWLHRYIGVPVLTWLLKQVSGCAISDAHCGLRAVNREALEKLRLQSEGMEFASEMLVEAARQGLKIKEIPISYPRKGQSKLRPISDGWRHLRFLLTYTFQSC